MPSTPAANDLHIVRQSGTPLRPEQVKFNKLLAEVRRFERKLAEWVEFQGTFAPRRTHEATGWVDRLVKARRALIFACVQVLEGRHGGQPPKKVERRLLTAVLIEFCVDHLLDGHLHDAEIIAVHDAYASESIRDVLDADAAEQRLEIRDQFGFDIPDDIKPQDFEEYVFEKLREKEGDPDTEADEPERSADKQGARARKRKKRKFTAPAQEAADPHQPLRDVFRKLASAMHPDRAVNEADRSRRTELMQRVNQAYADKNLLALFELQLEIEQIDEDHMHAMPVERLAHFNVLLKERLETLKREVSSITSGFQQTMMTIPRSLTPAAVEDDFAKWIETIQEETERLGDWTAMLPETNWRKRWLKDWDDERREAEQEVDSMIELANTLSALIEADLESRSTGKPTTRNRSRDRRR